MANKISTELLLMNRDVLAALVALGGCDPLRFVTDATDRFIVSRLIEQAA